MAKSKKTKPSFESPDDAAGTATPWVYRSDTGAPEEAPAGAASERAALPDAPPDQARPIADAIAPAPAASSAQAPAASSDRATAAQLLVDRYAKYAAAAGLVPVPVVDVAAIAGVQVAMLRALAGHYGVPFSRDRAKALIATLLGSLMPSLAGHQVLKIVGTLFGMISVSGFAVAATYAVGRLFVAHFESGGTLLDVDVERSRQQLQAQLSRP